MHQWDDAINDAMNDAMNEAAALDEAAATTLKLLPAGALGAGDDLTADQHRDLAHALQYLSEHFAFVSRKPSLLPDNLAHYRALHAEGLG